LTEVASVGVFAGQKQVRIGGHRDGLLKIAYELAWYWLGDPWLQDPIAQSMRAILNGQDPESAVHGKIFDDANAGIVAVGGDQRLVHVAYVYEYNGHLLLFIRLFDLLTAAFEVAADASIYPLPGQNAIVMHVQEGRFEETAFGRMEPGSVVWERDPDPTAL
jgi:hypothetical protein